VAEATNAWQAALRPFDLTHVQFVLLASLAWQRDGRPVSQRQLAEHARADPMMTSQVVRTLAANGLLQRQPHPTDARARALRATPAGIELANQANAAVEQVDLDYFDLLGDDRPAFTGMLVRLTDQTPEADLFPGRDGWPRQGNSTVIAL